MTLNPNAQVIPDRYADAGRGSGVVGWPGSRSP
jgi:hypothetical protein